MRFSRESYYGLRILKHMAGRPGAVIEASQIAAAARVPPAFAAKILQKLAAARIVRSQRGKTRGYSLAAPESLSVRAIVEALDGPDIFERCVFWRNRCNNARPCPLHDLWKRVRPEVAAQMERMTIAQMTAASARTRRARVAPRLPR
jgi:Rrf2 family protein